MPTLLTDRELDDEMADDWKGILERHSADNDEDGGEPASKGGKAEGAEAEQPEGEHAEADGKGKPEERAADDDSDRPRDRRATRDKATGRYKPLPKGEKAEKGERAEAPAARAAREEAPALEQPATAQPQARAHDVTRAPGTWSPKERAAWANVPQEARAAIHRREADFMAGQSQLLPDATFGREMRQTIDPFRVLIEAEGGNPAAAVLDLLRTAAVFRTGTEQQKYATIASIANRFGLNLRLFGTPPAQPGAAPTQPQPVQQFRDPRVDQLLAAQQTEAQQRAHQEWRDAETNATRWINEMDRQGKPRRPYANDVIDDMAAIIPQLKAANPALTHTQVLDAAYERAIWGNPEIRALLQQEQNPATNPQRRAENQRRAGEARRAASGNVTRRAGAPRPAKPGSWEDTIAETARDLGLIQT